MRTLAVALIIGARANARPLVLAQIVGPLVLALIVGACANARPRRPLDPALWHREQRVAPTLWWARSVASVRPSIDITPYVPDYHEDLRWPLTPMQHPRLEPAFPIALALASPGVGWLDLCAMGAQNRHTVAAAGAEHALELGSYLRGWCDAARGDADHACKELAPLLGSITGGLASAVRLDLANILAAEGDADRAEHWLTRYDIRDVVVLDTLAATFVELGKLDDAAIINRRAIDAAVTPSAGATCHRVARRIVLAHQGDWIVHQRDVLAHHDDAVADDELLGADEIDRLARARAPDTDCVRVNHMLRCSHRHECLAYLQERNIDVRAQQLIIAYENWPAGEVDADAWRKIGDAALQGASFDEGGFDLAVTAYEAAFRAGDCPPIHTALEDLQSAKPPSRLGARIDELRRLCPRPRSR